MPLTSDEERRLQEEFDRATEEARKAGERASLRRLIASRTRKLLERDYGEAERVLADEGIAGAISRMASRLFSGVIERWTREMRPLLEDIAETVTEPKENILGVGFNVSNPRMESFLDERVSELANTTSDTTYRQVMEVLREAQDEGLSVDKTAERIREKSQVQSRYRSRLIARTELHATSIGASYHQAVESGVISSKTWRTAQDADVRDAHRDLEGLTVGITEVFPNGLLYPIEPNCRCYLEFGVDFDALEESDPERFAGIGDTADENASGGGSGRSGAGGGSGNGGDGDGPLRPDEPGGPNIEFFEQATYDRAKFDRYLLNPTSTTGGADKFRWLSATYGFDVNDGQLFERFIREQLRNATEITYRGSSVDRDDPEILYRLYEIVIPDFKGPNGNRQDLLTAWAWDPRRDRPHFTNAYRSR